MSSQKSPKETAAAEKLPVLMLRPFGLGFDQVLHKFAADPRLSVAESASAAEAGTVARQFDWGFLLCHVASQDDLIKISTMMKVLGPGLKSKHVRVVTTVKQGMDPALEPHLKLCGVTEVIFEPVPERALLFKLERHIRTQHQLMARDRSSHSSESPSGGDGKNEGSREKSDGLKGKGDAKRNRHQHQIIWTPPIVVKSDFWLTNGAQTKEIMDRWLIHLKGPSTSHGRWSKVKDSGDPGVWQWLPLHPDTDPLLKEKGAWYFRGQKPELQGEIWNLTGPAPELLFGLDGKLIARKISVDKDGNLMIARDSSAALELVQAVRDSFDSGSATVGRNKRAGEIEEQDREEEAAASEAESRERESKAPSQGHRVRMVAPLGILSDCWLLDARKPRRVASKWVVRLLGPAGALGRWEQLTSGARSRVERWVWTPADAAKDPFIREPGAWIFHGQTPKFQDDTWILVGERPKLEFVFEAKDAKPPVAKFHVDEHDVLQVAKDSAQAESYRAAIIQSFSKHIRGDEADEERENEVSGNEAAKKKKKSPPAQEGDEEDGLVAIEYAEGAGGEAPERSSGPEAEDTETAAAEAAKKGAGRKDSNGDEDLVLDAAGEGDSDEARAAFQKKADRLGGGNLSGAIKGGEEKKRGTADYRAKDEQRNSKELSIELDPLSQGREMSIALDPEAEGREINRHDLEAEGARDGDEVGEERAQEGPRDKFKSKSEFDLNLSEKPAEAAAESNAEAPTGGEAKTAEEPAAKADAGLDAKGAPEEGADLAVKPIRPEAQLEVAVDPANPSLGPIALASLISELVMRRDMPREMVARKYCDYVAKASGGMRVELWVRVSSGGWRCANTSAGDAGACAEAQLNRCDGKGPVIEPGFVGSSVLRAGPGGKAVVGALVLSGPRAELVPGAWVAAAAHFTNGLVAAFARDMASHEASTSARAA